MADSLSEIEQIRARHHRGSDVNLEGEHYCEDCWGRDAYWPCDASLLLAALSESEESRDSLRFQLAGLEQMRVKDNAYLIERAESAEARLEALEGALAFYADESNADDEGKRARAALSRSAPESIEDANALHPNRDLP